MSKIALTFINFSMNKYHKTLKKIKLSVCSEAKNSPITYM